MFEKEKLFSAVVSVYGLEEGRKIFNALSLVDMEKLCEDLMKDSFNLLQVEFDGEQLSINVSKGSFKDLKVDVSDNRFKINYPLLRSFLKLKGLIYLPLPKRFWPVLEDVEVVLREMIE